MARPSAQQIANYLFSNIDIQPNGCFIWTAGVHPWDDTNGVHHERPIADLPYYKGKPVRRIAYAHMHPDESLAGMQVVLSPDLSCSELCINPAHAVVEETASGKAARELAAVGDELQENNPFAVSLPQHTARAEKKAKKSKAAPTGFRAYVLSLIKDENYGKVNEYVTMGGSEQARIEYLPDTYPTPMSGRAECTKCGTQSDINATKWIQHMGCAGFYALSES